ncbi:hypothetical protein [Pseudomonas solani]|uniref:hypothetical protein n=1 Tax=Pseudomonas solani TaxID=2731552 RepID=UPI003D6C4412
MLKGLIGIIIFKVAPVYSGARYSQNLAARISNPPLLLPMQVAREISLHCYRIAQLTNKTLGHSFPAEFEILLHNTTIIAVEHIQGAYDNEFQAKKAHLEANQWLADSIARCGIKAVGISKRPLLL